MSATPNAANKATLNRAMDLGRRGDIAAADYLLDDLLSTAPDQPDALQLKGMLARRRGVNEEAVRCFSASLSIDPLQPHVFNNLGNALQDLGRAQEAVEAYSTALSLAPDYHDPRLNLGLALIELDRAEEAHEALSIATRAKPGDAKSWAGLGRALRMMRRYQESIAALRRSLELRPDHVPTMLALAGVMRASNRSEEALELLRQCEILAPRLAEIAHMRGHCHQDLGQSAEAADAYLRAIAIRPDDRAVHDSLNRLQWQTGNDSAYLRSYQDALRLRPDDPGLLADLAHRLTLDGRSDESIGLLAVALARGAEGAELRYRLGQALWAQGRSREAIDQLAAARELTPDDPAISREMVRCLIILEHYEPALQWVDEVLARWPVDQQAIAYRALALRLLGDEAGARWINDERRLVSSTILTPPANAGSIDTFNARLEAVLSQLHRAVRHPLEQTLRGGTQTMDDLFDNPVPEIRIVQAMIEDAVRRYIAALPDDDGHPFLSRKRRDFCFEGSWSVRLRSGGYHMDHVHPEGWISSCYYVGVPEAVNSAPAHQGWLRLGQSALGLGSREGPVRLIRPQVGKLVLFPSYFYHGTIPFEDDRPRTTIAFDVVPR